MSFLLILSGLLKKNNGPTFLPDAVSQILWGLAQAPGDEPLPFALLELMLAWVPMPWDSAVAYQHPQLQRAASPAAPRRLGPSRLCSGF